MACCGQQRTTVVLLQLLPPLVQSPVQLRDPGATAAEETAATAAETRAVVAVNALVVAVVIVGDVVGGSACLCPLSWNLTVAWCCRVWCGGTCIMAAMLEMLLVVVVVVVQMKV
jgi:hypothetical protein